MILDSFRGWAAEHVDSARFDREGRFPEGVREGLHELGLMGLSIPEEYGGFGASSKVFGTRRGHVERHRIRSSGVKVDVSGVEVPAEHIAHAIAGVGNVTVERHGHQCHQLRHGDSPLGQGRSGDRRVTTRHLFDWSGCDESSVPVWTRDS
jgi:alkylation response protein AidB-like acyl-CoA dehydrogenase